MGKLYGLIPAAGKGTRARPYTSDLPKSMLEINGVPNLQRNVELMRDKLGIDDIVIITGYLGDVIEERLGDGSQFGVKITYIRNRELDKGLAWSILLGSRVIDDYFCVILSDECYIGSNHHELQAIPYRDALATCAIKEVDETRLIQRNYAVHLKDNRIERLIEKPQQVENDILGCGTFLFSPALFPRLREAFAAAPRNYVEFVSFLDELCRQGETLLPFWLTGGYVNINDRDSLELAKYHEKSSTFAQQTKALLIYSEGSEENLCFTLQRYRKLVETDSIHLIVPVENTLEEMAREFGVSIIRCPAGVDGYGEKIKYALDRIDSDILILTEADYAFPARDVEKLLAYMKEADMVIGTRTTRQLMEQGTDLQGAVRLANVMLAKFMELLWWRFEGRFSDVGCTFRAVWRSSYLRVRDRLESTGPEFSAEMMLEMINSRMRVIEIPVNYYNVSRAMSEKYRNVNTFFSFLLLFIKKRLR
jgi:dTDP-glucose pyrophosphorylase